MAGRVGSAAHPVPRDSWAGASRCSTSVSVCISPSSLGKRCCRRQWRILQGWGDVGSHVPHLFPPEAPLGEGPCAGGVGGRSQPGRSPTRDKESVMNHMPNLSNRAGNSCRRVLLSHAQQLWQRDNGKQQQNGRDRQAGGPEVTQGDKPLPPASCPIPKLQSKCCISQEHIETTRLQGAG